MLQSFPMFHGTAILLLTIWIKLPREIEHLVYGMTPQTRHYETKFAFPGICRVPISETCPGVSSARV